MTILERHAAMKFAGQNLEELTIGLHRQSTPLTVGEIAEIQRQVERFTRALTDYPSQ